MELPRLLSDLLGLLHGFVHCDFLLLLLDVAFLVLQTVLNDAFHDLLRCDGATRVDHLEFGHRFRDGVRISVPRWNVGLAVANSVDFEVFHEFPRDLVRGSNDNFINVLKRKYG